LFRQIAFGPGGAGPGADAEATRAWLRAVVGGGERDPTRTLQRRSRLELERAPPEV
jgi:hypothetical protein